MTDPLDPGERARDEPGEARSVKRPRGRAAVPGEGRATVCFVAAGDRLSGRYHLVREVARGGMGIVFEAEDETLDGHRVAIKVLPPELAENRPARRRLEQEALTAIQLAHPNVMRLNSFEEDGRTAYLVMEFLDGETLEEVLIERGPLPLEEVLEIAADAAAGLSAAHELGIVHRDVKPGNLMFTTVASRRVVKVTDFGIAYQIRGSMTRLTGGDSSGTLLYVAPEQLRGAEPDARSDQYALAASLYELLAGAPPISGPGLTQQILNAVPRPVKGVPESVNAALLRALEKLPEDRFADLAGFLEALRGATPTEAATRTAAPAMTSEPAPVAGPSLASPPLTGLPRIEEGLLRWSHRLLWLLAVACFLFQPLLDFLEHDPLFPVGNGALLPDCLFLGVIALAAFLVIRGTRRSVPGAPGRLPGLRRGVTWALVTGLSLLAWVLLLEPFYHGHLASLTWLLPRGGIRHLLWVHSGMHHPGGVEALAFTDEGELVSMGRSEPRFRFWDPGGGRELRTLSLAAAGLSRRHPIFGRLGDHPGGSRIDRMGVSGRRALGYTWPVKEFVDMRWRVVDLRTGAFLDAFEGPFGTSSLDFLVAGDTLVRGGSRESAPGHVWHARRIVDRAFREDVVLRTDGLVLGLSPDGWTAVVLEHRDDPSQSRSRRTLGFYETRTGERRGGVDVPSRIPPGKTWQEDEVLFSRDGLHLALMDPVGGTLVTISLEEPRIGPTFALDPEIRTPCVLQPGGERLYCVDSVLREDWTGGIVFVEIHGGEGQELGPDPLFSWGQHGITSLACSRDGSMLAVGAKDGSIRIFPTNGVWSSLEE